MTVEETYFSVPSVVLQNSIIRRKKKKCSTQQAFGYASGLLTVVLGPPAALDHFLSGPRSL